MMDDFISLIDYGKLSEHQYMELYRHIVDLEEDLEKIYSNFTVKTINCWKDPQITILDGNEEIAHIYYGFKDNNKPTFKVKFPFIKELNKSLYFCPDEIHSGNIANEIFSFTNIEIH